MVEQVRGADAGAVLADRYHLLRRIGAGGMGEVWEAEDRVLDRRVAVKLLSRVHVRDESMLARFNREARTAARLTHQNLATVFDYGESDDQAFLVMELIDGETLSERLRRQGPLPPDEAADVVADAADGVAAAHAAGIVHRDIKPSNIMLTESGVKVMDFGIASGLGDPLTATGTVIGTASYLAPERVRGEGAGPESDVYGLGAVLFEALTGEKAFQGETEAETALAHLHRPPPDVRESDPSIPESIVEAGQAALAKEAAARPSASELAGMLRTGRRSEAPAVAAAPTQTTPLAEPAPAAAPPPAGRRVWPLVVAVLLFLLLGAGIAWALTDDGDDPPEAAPTPSTAAPTSAPAPPAPTTTPTTVATTQPPAPSTTAPAAEPQASGDLAGAATNYIETLASRDFDAAWALTSPEFQAAQDREQWESFWGGYESLAVAGEPEVDESSGTVVLPVSFDGSTESYQLQLVQDESGRWLVDGPVGR